MNRGMWILLMGIACLLPASGRSQDEPPKFAIVLHGGAGGDPSRWSEEYQQQRRDGMNAALNLGVERLRAGDAALDVVEAVIRLLEDDATFNAGRGAVLNEQGQHELDACIMHGKDLRCGAVASVTQIKHPISLARKVMSETRHVLLMGEGADKFGLSLGLESAPAEYFQTDRQKKAWQAWKNRQTELSHQNPGDSQANDPRKDSESSKEPYFGTVGCVVLDTHGDLVAGTSTGGLMGKRWGRVGDSPIVGAGNYADNGTCAVSGTGIGEEFIRRNVAADVAARMRYGGLDLKSAAQQTIATLPEDAGGIIAVDYQGNMVMEFNTVGMSRAYANSSGIRGVFLGRENEE